MAAPRTAARPGPRAPLTLLASELPLPLPGANGPPRPPLSLQGLEDSHKCPVHVGSYIRGSKLYYDFHGSPALQGTLRLSVKQSPALLRVEQGSQANLTCQVAHDQGWEQLRFLWTKDGEELCQPRVISDCLSPEVCGPQGQLSWRAPETLILRLDPVRAEYSGNYVCWAAVEIPELVQGEGNGTELLVEAGTSASSIPGFLLGLLVAGGMAITAVALCLGIWGHRRCGQRDSGPGNAFYSNVLYRPRGTPKKTEASPGEGKVPDPPRANQKGLYPCRPWL
ncbi:transmembrane and immunoglobulin domain-containing protein 2 [Rhynchocyon petersi]